jgi:hypothetical protein
MDDRGSIVNTINRFMTCFDSKEWVVMASILTDPVSIDYTDLRGQPARAISRDEYISARQFAHGHTKTHHLISNFDVKMQDVRAMVKASCMIYRTNGADFFNSHALYEFGLQKDGNLWLINSVAQKILWNDGDAELHAGVPIKPDNIG